ncbi:MAG: hypothetical protein IKN22_03185 [Bacteroidaceae bacterium]|nr:hypothetical protein [Bacteroidaceae bacterium]MBR3633522.1 hypothetical protein [Bacteroidaceae bacterium]MBR3733515.1 hypothetical protein [Bacteroidaceae bacterium]MBR4649415.1 hypothetical protein [Bacteroidaceae bacterium]MBR6714263.1 hypothetical protein [Bacteroidaceae bacterium]
MKKLTTALLLLLTICSCSSKQGETNEKDTVDSLEAIKQDSIRMVQEKKEQARADSLKAEEESEQFCKQLSFNDLLALLDDEGKNSIEKTGLSLVYKEEEDYDGGDVSCEEIVYGKYIEKEEGNKLISTTGHSCFFKIQLDTSKQAWLNFSNKDDADHFYNQALKDGKASKKYIITTNPDGNSFNIGSPFPDGSSNPMYDINRPKLENGFYQIAIDFYY